jgi:hypothetical protein
MKNKPLFIGVLLLLNSVLLMAQTKPATTKKPVPPTPPKAKTIDLAPVIIRPEKAPVVTPMGNELDSEKKSGEKVTNDVEGPKSYDSVTPPTPPKLAKNTNAWHAGKRSYMGIRVGANFSTIEHMHKLNLGSASFDKAVYSEPYEPGLLAGLAFDLALSKRIGLQFDVNYSQQGYRYKEKATDAGFLFRENLVNVPLMLNVKMGQKVKIVVGGGVYGGYRFERGFAPHDSTDSSPKLIETKYNTNVTVKEERYDFGPVANLGVQFPLGKMALRFEGRYQHSLQNAIDDQLNSLKYGKYRVFSGNASLFYPLGKK